MAVKKIEIFLASRFEEFAEVRQLLKERISSFPAIPLEAVDFNDGRMSHRPPLEKCTQAIRQSEIMVLLIGETYGGIPQGETLSYTHLEYRAALEEEESTIILPFFIGDQCDSTLKSKSSDTKLALWQTEVANNHTPGFICDDDPESVARIIFDWVLKSLLDMGSEATQNRVEDYFESSFGAESSSAGVSFAEMSEYDRRIGRHEDQDEDESRDENPPMEVLIDLLSNPARTAMEEQLRLANVSQEIGDRSAVVYHFRNALKHTPNHLKACLSLSRILLSTNRRKDAGETLQLALRASRLADYESQPTIAAGSLIVASQACAKLGDFSRGLELAQMAVQKAPTFSRAHIELACQYAHQGMVAETFRVADEVFRIHASSIPLLDHEPAIQSLGPAYSNYKTERLNKLRKGISDVLEAEKDVSTAISEIFHLEELEMSPESVLGRINSYPLFQLIQIGKESARRQYEHLQELATYLQDDFKRHRNVLRDSSVFLEKKEEGGSERLQLERFIARNKNNSLALDILLVVIAVLFAGGVLTEIVPLPRVFSILSIVPVVYLFFSRKNRPHLKAQACLAMFDRTRTKLNEVVEVFTKSLQLFENKTLPHRMFCPWSGNNRFSEGQIRRAVIKGGREDFFNASFCDKVFPTEIAKLTHVKLMPPQRTALYMAVHGDNGELVLSRGSVFFNRSKNKKIEMNLEQDWRGQNLDDEPRGDFAAGM